MGGTVRLSEICQEYGDRVQFLTIYIKEAHPKDGWWFGDGLIASTMAKILSQNRVSLDTYQPKTLEERRAVAAEMIEAIDWEVPLYVDEMDDAVNEAYAAQPTRLYLIGLDGRVVYAGGVGPMGFSPEELKTAIDNYLD